MVRKPLLLQILNSPDHVEQICENLINLANENGGEDNISAIVVQVM